MTYLVAFFVCGTFGLFAGLVIRSTIAERRLNSTRLAIQRLQLEVEQERLLHEACRKAIERLRGDALDAHAKVVFYRDRLANQLHGGPLS